MALRRSAAQRARDLEHTADLYLKGWTQSQIANFLEVSQPQVSYDVRQLKKQWNEERRAQYDFYVNIELHRLRLLERETWDAWDRSKTPKEQTLSEQLRSAAPADGDDDLPSGAARLKIQRRSVEQSGDPRFLETLLKIHSARTKLLGIGEQTTARSADAVALSTPQLALLAEYLTTEPAVAE